MSSQAAVVKIEAFRHLIVSAGKKEN